MDSRTRGTHRKGVHRRLGASLRGLTLKVGGALEEESEDSRSWLGPSFMVGVRGQVSPGSGNSSGGLRYSSSEVMGLLKGEVDPPEREIEGIKGKDEDPPENIAQRRQLLQARILVTMTTSSP